jgi:flagellar hook-basal body complex protein FliE
MDPIRMATPRPLPGVDRLPPNLGAAPPAPGPVGPTSIRFEDVLFNSINQVNELDREAQTQIAAGLVDGDLAKAEIFTAVKKADIALRTLLQIRNKVLEAYNEIRNIRI